MGFISPNLAGMGSSAPPPAPPETAPKDQPQQTETIESLSARIKDKYPDYGAVDDRELVRRVIAKHPEYQTRLAGTELQRLTPGGAAPPAEQPGFLSQAADVVGNQVKGIAAESVKPWTALHEGYEGYERAREGGASIPRSLAFGGVKAANASSILDPIKDASEIPDRYNTYKPALGKVGAGLYAGLAPTAAQATGVNLPGMEESARTGNKTGVVAQAAVPAAEVAIPEAVHQVPVLSRAAEAVKAPIVRAVRAPLETFAPRLAVPEAPKALTQAIQPGVNIPRAAESINIAGPRLQQVRQATGMEFKTPADLLEGVKTAKGQVWDAIEQRMGPVAQLHADTSPVAQAMEGSISKRTQQQFPAQAKAIQERAATYRNTMSLRDIENAIQDANDDLKNFYKRGSAGDSPTSSDTAATEAEVKALRTLLDQKVEKLSGAGVADLKREYGALRDVERATARANAVATRQKGANLWEGLAALRAAGDFASGNLLGAAKGAGTLAVGRWLAKLRDPNFLIDQSFQGSKAFKPAQAIPPAPGPNIRGALPPAPSAAIPMPGQIALDTSGGPRGVPEGWGRPRLLNAAPAPAREPLVTPEPASNAPRQLPGGQLSKRIAGLLPKQNVSETGPTSSPIVPGERRALPPASRTQRLIAESAEESRARGPAPERKVAPIQADEIRPQAQASLVQPRAAEAPRPQGQISKAFSSAATPQDEMRQLSKQMDTLRTQRNRTNDPEKFAKLDKKYQAAKDRYYQLKGDGEPEETPAKQSRTATFDSLPKEDQEWISNWAKEISHLPQSLREQEMSDLQKYGEQGTLLKERIAMQHLERQKNGAEAEPGNERALGGASGEAARQERESSQQRRERQLRRIKPDRESPISYRDRPKTAREQTS